MINFCFPCLQRMLCRDRDSVHSFNLSVSSRGVSKPWPRGQMQPMPVLSLKFHGQSYRCLCTGHGCLCPAGVGQWQQRQQGPQGLNSLAHPCLEESRRSTRIHRMNEQTGKLNKRAPSSCLHVGRVATQAASRAVMVTADLHWSRGPL